ncbi:MAG TPA: OmpA family protein [Burkholderiaceae bacterium]|nr:OmpA family protein [Burkholderiaceae bacterium]
MFDEEDREIGYALAIAVALAIFISIFTLSIAAGSAIGQFGKKAGSGASAMALPVAGATAATATTAAALPDATTVKLYFELGTAELPGDALTRLAPLITAAKGAPASVLVLSGYHDASGDPVANAELAKQRAFAVRDLLATAGVSERGIELAKPDVTTGGADPREARRVDVTLR